MGRLEEVREDQEAPGSLKEDGVHGAEVTGWQTPCEPYSGCLPEAKQSPGVSSSGEMMGVNGRAIFSP